MHTILMADAPEDRALELICMDCGEVCQTHEESFSYAGTHCTHGQPGVHFTGNQVSNCCSADWFEAGHEPDGWVRPAESRERGA